MKKNVRLLFQIGILIVVVFIIGSILASYYLFVRSKNLYLSAKNEMMTINLKTIKEELLYESDGLLTEYIDYWEQDPKQIIAPRTRKEIDTIAKIWSNTDISDKEYFFKLDEYEKFCDAKSSYPLLSDDLYYTKVNLGYDQARCIDIKKDRAIVLLDTGNGSGYGSPVDEDPYENLSNTENGKDIITYALGDTIDLNLTDHKVLKRFVDGKEDTTVFEEDLKSQEDKALYVGYIPIYSDDGELKCVISIIYDWTDVYTTLYKDTVRTIIIEFLVGLLLAGGLLLIFIYGIAIKPLQKVNGALRNYMKNKDSAQVSAQIKTIKSRNEIGVLADDVNQLAQEIDRYTEENIKLATEKERVTTELDLATKIQSEMLIKDFPERPEYELYASMEPAKEVGGDFYDFFAIGENHLGIVIADVSGKGIPAALLMMSAMTSIRNFALLGGTPAEILKEVNDDLARRNISDMFVTVWLGILNIKTGVIEAANAGHEYPAIRSNGRFELFKDKHGFVLGGMGGMEYTNYEIQLSKGDGIFVYTDGIAEANSDVSNLYGTDRIIEALNSDADASPKDLISNVNKSVDEFVESAEQFDDMTMLCLTYKG